MKKFFVAAAIAAAFFAGAVAPAHAAKPCYAVARSLTAQAGQNAFFEKQLQQIAGFLGVSPGTLNSALARSGYFENENGSVSFSCN